MSLFYPILLLASVTVGAAITTPFVGVLVRFRANYNPKGLQLDSEGNVQPHTGPMVTSYFGMMARVKRLEGWSGFYKGFMPTILYSFFAVLIASILVGTPTSRGQGKYATPDIGPFHLAIFGGLVLIMSLPTVIITNRAITTPHKLPWFNLLLSLRALLTPYERRRPWVLYLTPGLLVAELSNLVYSILILGIIRRWVFPISSSNSPNEVLENITVFRVILYVAVAIISTVVICPLEVISTRLSIQRNHATAGFTASAEEEDPIVQGLDFAAAEEDVIALRNEDDPYVGFADCAKRIVNDEGYRTLYRAWWLTLIGVIFGG